MVPTGSETTLGEIAHIIARSIDGPRGDSELLEEDRDDYKNLILLCPTHHKMIDDNPVEWNSDKVRAMKTSHEDWVTQQLTKSHLVVREFNFDSFLSSHIKKQINIFNNQWWIYSALTPLSISDDAINPKNQNVIGVINSCRFPEAYSANPTPNIRLTRPNEYGITNEDLRSISNGQGHRICVFRSGHAEFAICLHDISGYINSVYRQKYPVEQGYNLVHYGNISECLEEQIKFLKNLWDTCLPYYNMIFTVLLSPTAKSKLVFDKRIALNVGFSTIISSDHLQITKVVDRTYSFDDLLYLALQRIVESYGWDLPKLRDNDGFLSMPSEFMKS
jgi:hypothetical protein